MNKKQGDEIKKPYTVVMTPSFKKKVEFLAKELGVSFSYLARAGLRQMLKDSRLNENG